MPCIASKTKMWHKQIFLNYSCDNQCNIEDMQTLIILPFRPDPGSDARLQSLVSQSD